MNGFNSAARVLFASLLAASGVSLPAVAEDGQLANTPIVRFAQKMDGPQQPGGKQCSVSVPAAGSAEMQKKMSDAGCGNDVVTFFRLENVQSSTVVALSSENSCGGGDWMFSVRAIKQPTTSIWLDIRDLKNMQEGDIVAAGVAVNSIRYSGGSIEGKLSCTILYPPSP